MPKPYAPLLMSLFTSTLSAMTSMEFVHALIHLDQKVYYQEDSRAHHNSLDYQASGETEHGMLVTEPTPTRRILVRFIPNEKTRICCKKINLVDHSHDSQRYPISLPLCALIKDRWHIASLSNTVYSIDDIVGYRDVVIDGDRAVEAVTFRATLREPGTSIDINYQPFSQNVEVVSLLSSKRHANFLWDMLVLADRDKHSTIQTVVSTEYGSPERAQIISRYSLQDFASLVNSAGPIKN